MRANDLREILAAICNDGTDARGEEALARICMDMAKVYLRILERRGQRIHETCHPQEMDGLAADAVADLFARDSEGRLSYFHKYFTPLCRAEVDAREYLVRLQRLITKQVQYYLNILYRRRDPEGAKLLRTIREAVKNHPRMSLQRDLNGVYVLFQPDSDASETCILRPSPQLLAGLAQQAWRVNMSIAKMMSELHGVISACCRQPVGILLMDLVRLIRALRANTADRTTMSVISNNCAFEEWLRCRQSILAQLGRRIQTTYVEKNKLTLQQGLCLYQSISDLTDDLLQGENPDDNYIYVQRHWPEMSYQEYMRSIHTIFEYLIKSVKMELQKAAKIIF